MTAAELSTVVSSDVRRSTIVNLKHVNEIPLRNALESFDRNGDGKIDITELRKIVYWYGLWKYASIGLCMVIFTLVWSTFGLTIWAINLTKEYTVTDGVLTGGDEVVKMSVASTYIPLNWATLLDRRHLDALDSVTIDVKQSSGTFTAGVYNMKVASYLHANSTYLKVFGKDGSRVWVNSGKVVLYHPDAKEAIMVCGASASACNTLAVDVKPEYLQQLVQRGAALFESSADFELPAEVDGVSINKAEGEGVTCLAAKKEVLDFQKYATANRYYQWRTDMEQRWMEAAKIGGAEPDDINIFRFTNDDFKYGVSLGKKATPNIHKQHRLEDELNQAEIIRNEAADAPIQFKFFGKSEVESVVRDLGGASTVLKGQRASDRVEKPVREVEVLEPMPELYQHDIPMGKDEDWVF